MVASHGNIGPFSSHPDSPARHLRGNYAGVLRIGDRIIKRGYVIDPATGNPVVPVPADGPDAPEAEELDSLTFHIPDEGEDALVILVTGTDIDPRTHEAADRHLIYHGPARDRRWLRLDVDSARRQNQIFDPSLLIAPNPLRALEPAICKATNADRAALLLACQHYLGANHDIALMVGIDPLGIDLRTRFGPHRIEFPKAAMARDKAEAAVQAILARDAFPSDTSQALP